MSNIINIKVPIILACIGGCNKAYVIEGQIKSNLQTVPTIPECKTVYQDWVYCAKCLFTVAPNLINNDGSINMQFQRRLTHNLDE